MTTRNLPKAGMDVTAALQVLAQARRAEQIVVTNQGSARIWPRFTRHELDLHYNPSTMGGAIPLALGLALGQPSRDVLVISGDGALLMSLGSLVTVAAAGASNLTVVVLDNGLYEVTGGQRTPGSGRIDFAGLARAAGFPSADCIGDLASWQNQVRNVLAQLGPRFIALQVDGAPAELLRSPTPPLAEQLAAFRRALGTSA